MTPPMPKPLQPRVTLYERYHKDTAFRYLVDTMHNLIEYGNYTPTEIREAAMLAQIMYEERHSRPVYFTKDDVLSGRV